MTTQPHTPVRRTLVEGGLIAHTADEETPGFLPAQLLAATRVDAILQMLRGERHDDRDNPDTAAEVLDRLYGALESSPTISP